MREKYLGLFKSLLYKLLLLENAIAFNTSENIWSRSKELPSTPINNSVTYFDSFLKNIFSQQNHSAKNYLSYYLRES
jgi:vancomycin permeability regulator SanA